MKRILMLIAMVWFANGIMVGSGCEVNDPPDDSGVERLSIRELMENKTPAAVALNFVESIYYSDTDGMLSYMTPEMREVYEEQRNNDGYPNYDPYFSIPDSNLNIKGWKKLIDQSGYEFAVIWEGKKKADKYGHPRKQVTVACVRLLNMTRVWHIDGCGKPEVDVLLVYISSCWKVEGIK